MRNNCFVYTKVKMNNRTKRYLRELYEQQEEVHIY